MKRARTAMMFTPSLEECVAACVNAGLPAREGEKFFTHYEMVGWRYGRAKVPITSLALAVQGWKYKWEDNGRPGMENGKHHKGPISGADKMIFRDEYQRIVDRMKVLRNVDSHSSMSPSDRDEYKKLVARRNELRAILGITL